MASTSSNEKNGEQGDVLLDKLDDEDVGETTEDCIKPSSKDKSEVKNADSSLLQDAIDTEVTDVDTVIKSRIELGKIKPTDKDKHVDIPPPPSAVMGNLRDSSTCKKPAQAMKRRPDKELNHDNWDQEDEPEEKGEFVKASIEQLKERRFLTAKRKQKPTSTNPNGNPFGALNLTNAFGRPTVGASNHAGSMFSFGNVQTQPTTTSLAPKFDFSSFTSSDKSENEQDSDKIDETVVTKKFKTESGPIPSRSEPADVDSATTV